VLLFLLALATAATAGDDTPVRIVTEQLPPFSYPEGDEVRGASTEVVRAVMNRAGLDFAIEVLPWRRAFDAALHDRNVLIYSVARNAAREDQLAWIGKICDRRLALYCLRERQDLLNTPLLELHQATVAVIQGDASIEVLRQRGFGDANLHILRDAEANLASTHVVEGRSDFFVSNPDRMRFAVRGTPLQGRFAQHSVIWEGDGYYLAANPSSSPELLARISAAFSDLEASGELKQIFDRALAEAERQ